MDVSDFAVASGLLTLFVIGTVELIKQAFNRNWKAVAIIMGAAVVGGLGGEFMLPVIGLPVGIAAGLSASGLVTGLEKVGTGTEPLDIEGV